MNTYQIRGDNEPNKFVSSLGSARSKLDLSSSSARDLNESSRARQSSARKAREQLDFYLFYTKKNYIEKKLY